jgi:hypothetical protein
MKIQHAAITLLFLSLAGSAAAGQITVTTEGSSEEKSLDMHYIPSELTLAMEFKDANGNNILNAEETATLNLTVTNTGEGKAKKVTVEVVPGAKLPGLTIKGPKEIALILPGESRSLGYTLSGTFDLPDGETEILISATDYFGVDAEPIELVLKTAALLPPKLVISEYKLNDSGAGQSVGNDNGLAETGETIEVKATIQNQGTGLARNVVVLIESPSTELTFPVLPVFKIGNLLPKGSVPINFTLTIPGSYSGEEKISLAVHLSESTGNFKATATIDFTIEPAAEPSQ